MGLRRGDNRMAAVAQLFAERGMVGLLTFPHLSISHPRRGGGKLGKGTADNGVD